MKFVKLAMISPSAAVLTVFASLICSPLLVAQNFSMLHSFTGADGASPGGGLSLDTLGNLYGTTVSGGGRNLGTIFKLKTNGTEVVLHSFSGYPSDGNGPFAGLIRDAAGNFLGMTFEGGNGRCGLRGLVPVGCGTVFKLDTTGHESTLYSFQGSLDGSSPQAALVRDSSGNLYGTTVSPALRRGAVKIARRVAKQRRIWVCPVRSVEPMQRNLFACRIPFEHHTATIPAVARRTTTLNSGSVQVAQTILD